MTAFYIGQHEIDDKGAFAAYLRCRSLKGTADVI
jgi:hypothetical protein